MEEHARADDFIDRQMPKSETWREETQILELFMTYVRESLRFILYSFFKRCRIIIAILNKQKQKELHSTDLANVSRAVSGGTRNRKETRESIIADMLA